MVKGLAQTNDEEIQEIKQNLYKLERALVCADENGLFRITTDSPKFMDIIENIGLAKKALENEKNLTLDQLLVAWKMYRLANHQYHQVINSANFWWKFRYQFGGHFIIYFFVL